MQGYKIDIMSGWKCAIDEFNTGREQEWNSKIPAQAVDAIFPGYLQETLGDFHGVGWYWSNFNLPEEKDGSLDYLLELGYTNYYAQFWVNGQYIDAFEGQQICYTLTVTDAVRTSGNLLAIRIINPTEQAVDGILQSETIKGPVFDTVTPGGAYNYGGIVYGVVLSALPRQRIERIVVHSNWETGSTEFSAELSGIPEKAGLLLTITDKKGNLLYSQSMIPDSKKMRLIARIPSPKLWSFDNPNLYAAQVILQSGEEVLHARTVRFGFRELKVKDGFFFLNGKRIYLKCGLQVFHYPTGHNGGRDMGMLYNEFAAYKAMGFNTIRFMQMTALPEVLDICDELGLMVYEEHPASWHSIPSPRFHELFEKHLIATIRRDINHPSILIWGLLNESHYEEERDLAQNILGRLRDEDESRLVLLSSGRWDTRMDVGSICNPYSREWECQWGSENPGAPKLEALFKTENPGPWAPELGDVHIYPDIPMSDAHKRVLRTHAADAKPAFLSECGIGTMEDIFASLRNLERDGVNPNTPDYRFFREMNEQLAADWERYGLGDVFAFPEDMVRQSLVKNLRDREVFFDCIRSNPQFCGYSFTSLTDFFYAGGGALDFYRNIKPGMATCIREGWAPLRWCLFVDATHIYAGSPFTVEAVLANEDFLKPGSYSASLCILSDAQGCVWKEQVRFHIPEAVEGGYSPFAVPVYKKQLRLELPEGEYRVSVRLDHGAVAAAGRAVLYVSDPKPLNNKKIKAIGLSEQATDVLSQYAVTVAEDADVIIVGNHREEELDNLFRQVSGGATAVFLDMAVLAENADHLRDHKKHLLEKLPFHEKGYCTWLGNWFYHHESIIKNHPYLTRLKSGMLEYEYYRMVTPLMVVKGTENLIEAAAVGIGLPESSGCLNVAGYAAGEVLGKYRYGEGVIVLNTFRVLENLGTNPVADQILLNIIENC